MPFPSRGCTMCKARHIKCDETQPVCGQCLKSNRRCESQSGDNSSLFIDENFYAISGSQRPRGCARRRYTPPRLPRPAMRKGSESSTVDIRFSLVISDNDSRLNSRSLQAQSIPAPMTRSLQDEAFADFSRKYLEMDHDATESLWGFANKYKAFWDPSTSSSILNLAVSSMALATFGRRHGIPDAIAAGCRVYSDALYKTGLEIKSGTVLTDQLVLTTMILSAIEDRMGNLDPKRLFSEGFRHQDGALALLNFRKQQRSSLASQNDLRLDRCIRKQVIRSALYRAIAIPQWLQNGADFGEEGVELVLDRCWVRASDLRARAQPILKTSKGLQEHERMEYLPELQGLVQEASALEHSLEAWAAGLPYEWMFLEGPSPRKEADVTTNDDIYWDRTFHIYSNANQASTWNRYRAIRLITNMISSNALSHINATGLNSDMNAPMKRIGENVGSLVDDICASLPFHFGLTGSLNESVAAAIENTSANAAHALIWPLIVASATMHISDKQRQWIKAKVKLIGKTLGSGILEVVASIDLHLHANLQRMPLPRNVQVVPMRASPQQEQV